MLNPCDPGRAVWQYPTTTWAGSCHFCGTKVHKALECDRKSEVDGDTVYPLAYLFKKWLVNEWGVITEKGKKKKGL